MNRIYAIIAALVVVAAGGWFVLGGGSAPQSTSLAPGPVNAEGIEEDVDISGVQDMMIGNPDAAVTVIEYASYTCPHCGSFHQNQFKQLKADYIDTGKINFIYREVYFDRFGLWASLMARCAGPEKFFGITDLLYASQSTWSRAGGGDPAVIAEELRKIGRLAGMDTDTINSCLQDEDKIRTMVAWFQAKTSEDEITSTPSFVINGKTYSNMGYADFSKLIDEASE